MKTSVIALGFVSLFLSLACSSGGGGGNLPTDGGSGTGATGATGNGGSGGSGNTGNGGSGGATGGASGASGSGGSTASNTECGAFTSTTCLCTSVEPGQGNDEKCSPTENASGGYCCASAGWPNSSDCLCGPMLCNTVVDTCTCAIGLWSDGEDSCTGDECCLDSLGGCKCGPGACEGGGTPVTACDSTVFGCGPNSTMVPACH